MKQRKILGWSIRSAESMLQNIPYGFLYRPENPRIIVYSRPHKTILLDLNDETKALHIQHAKVVAVKTDHDSSIWDLESGGRIKVKYETEKQRLLRENAAVNSDNQSKERGEDEGELGWSIRNVGTWLSRKIRGDAPLIMTAS